MKVKKITCTGNYATTNGCKCPACAAHDAAHAASLVRDEAEFRARYPFSYSLGLEDGWHILESYLEA